MPRSCGERLPPDDRILSNTRRTARDWPGSARSRVDIRQLQGTERSDDAFRRFASLEGTQHKIQQDPALADAKHARWIFPQRNIQRQRLKIHSRHAVEHSRIVAAFYCSCRYHARRFNGPRSCRPPSIASNARRADDNDRSARGRRSPPLPGHRRASAGLASGDHR